MAFFCGQLHNLIAPGTPFTEVHPVLDKTGIEGRYDFHFFYQRPSRPGADAPATSADDLMDALRRQLGLRVVEVKSPQEVVVVDHLEKIPTEN